MKAMQAHASKLVIKRWHDPARTLLASIPCTENASVTKVTAARVDVCDAGAVLVVVRRVGLRPIAR